MFIDPQDVKIESDFRRAKMIKLQKKIEPKVVLNLEEDSIILGKNYLHLYIYHSNNIPSSLFY